MPAGRVATPGSVRDFQLPPAPTPTPSSAPEVQGPVDSDAPISTRPRDIAAPAATPTRTPAPAPAPTASQTATVQPLPQSTSSPVVQPIPGRREPQQRTTPTRAPSADAATAVQTGSTPDSAELAEADTANGAELDGVTAPRPSRPMCRRWWQTLKLTLNSTVSFLPRYFWWVLALVLLMGLSVALLVWWRRREPSAATIPTIEPPLGKTRPAQMQ